LRRFRCTYCGVSDTRLDHPLALQSDRYGPCMPVPLAPASERDEASRGRTNRAAAVAWAQGVLADPTSVVLHIQPSRTVDAYAQQICVLNLDGQVAFSAEHPDPATTLPALMDALNGRRIITYDAVGEDLMVLHSELARWGKVEHRAAAEATAALSASDIEDAVAHYAAFVGDPHPEGGYRWQALPTDGSAATHCLALLDVLCRMGSDRGQSTGAGDPRLHE
jgi:hypothetical protein